MWVQLGYVHVGYARASISAHASSTVVCLSLSCACAHKYDCFWQKDYFQLSGFAATNPSNGIESISAAAGCRGGQRRSFPAAVGVCARREQLTVFHAREPRRPGAPLWASHALYSVRVVWWVIVANLSSMEMLVVGPTLGASIAHLSRTEVPWVSSTSGATVANVSNIQGGPKSKPLSVITIKSYYNPPLWLDFHQFRLENEHKDIISHKLGHTWNI